MKQEIPVLLLTGYLGSGKTTLLNRILSNKKGVKFAVIVNDIGEVNIDAALIQQGGIVNQKDDSLVALQNGCICCTLKMDLVQQLQDLIELQRFDYIVIEASGICEPAPIAQTICSIPQMAPQVTEKGYPRLDCIVTVVDALRMRDEFGSGLDLTRQNIDEEDIENLVIQQIEFCNIVLLNKASEVTPDELGRIRQIVRTLQPKAAIIDTNFGDVELDKIINTGLFDFDSVATSATWIQEVEKHHDEDDDDDEEEHEHHHHDHEHGHEHEHHHHHDEGEAEEYGIGTYVYYARRPFELGLFICYFRDEQETCYVFEQAGKQVSIRNAGQWYATMPKAELEQFMEDNPGLRRDWDEQYGDRMQKLVFIGQHLDKELIAKELNACLV